MKYFEALILTLLCAAILNAQSYKYHTVKDGETLWRISKNYNIAMDKLCEINKIKDAAKVKQGMTLKIPADGKTDDAKPKQSAQTSAKPAADKPDEVRQSSSSSSVKMSPKSPAKTVDLQIPMNGNVKPFITPNTKGIIIFQNESLSKSVVSSDTGTVSYVSDLPGYGLSVLIKHSDNVVSVYSGFSGVSVRQGDNVKRGQFIGSAGRLSKYDKIGILFYVQKNQEYLRYDARLGKFTE